MADLDYQAIMEIAASGFFVILSFSLLVRYRSASQRLAASTDLGRDLWSALEQRLKKQDERILELMGKLELAQLRAADQSLPRRYVEATPVAETAVPTPKQLEPASRRVHQATSARLDPTEKVVVRVLDERPRTSVEIKELIGKSREHSARLMKDMFDRGLVSRDDSKKPFVYELTDAGRRYLSVS